jgi:hypothetical protein
MPNLGDFTAAMAEADPEPNTFTLHGEVFALQPTLTAYAFLRFSRLAGEVDITDEEQLGAVNMIVLFDLLQDAILPEDWDRFEQTIKKHRVGISTLMAIASAIQEGATGRPTDAPSGSPGGASTTSSRSSRKPSASSATKKKAAAKKTTAARSRTARQPKTTGERIEELRRSEEFRTPSENDAKELAAVLGLPARRTGSTG